MTYWRHVKLPPGYCTAAEYNAWKQARRHKERDQMAEDRLIKLERLLRSLRRSVAQDEREQRILEQAQQKGSE